MIIRHTARSMRSNLRLAEKWLHYRLGRVHDLPYPDRMYIESTNSCNLACVMCPSGRKEMKRPKGLMDFAMFRRIVDEMAPHVTVTTLHIWGEPLLHPRIFDMIAYCRAAGLRCEISTNATLLDEEKAHRLLQQPPSAMYLCLDGVRRETYESIRRKGDFEQTRNNIKRFLELRSASAANETRVNLQIIEMKPTATEIDEFKAEWSVPGVDAINVKAFDSWGNQIEEITTLGPVDASLPASRYPCPNLWYHVHIYWDGTLVSCDRDFDAAHPLGNVSEGVMRAWNGGRMADLRQKHVSGDIADVPACKHCVEWAWWKPSPFQSHGNAPADRG